MIGQMMDFQLTINSVMRHGRSLYGNQEIVSVTSDNPLHRYTFEEAFGRVCQVAGVLADMGLNAGDRVGTLAWNDYRHFEIYYAVSCSELVTHTINPRLFPEQLDFVVNHAEDRVIFVDPTLLPALEAIKDKLTKVERIIVMTSEEHMPDSSLALECYETLLAGRPTEFTFPEFDEKTASSLCYTSGTTGDPKGVLYSHRSTVLHAMGGAVPSVFGLTTDDIILPIVPMFHVNAWAIPYAAVMSGTKLVFPGPKMGDGAAIADLINAEKVTVSAGVPTVWLAMLNHLRETKQTVETLTRIIVGGAACPQAIMEEMEQAHGVYVHHAWGMTEMSPLGTFNTIKPELSDLPADEKMAYRLKQGLPPYGVELDVFDEEGNAQPHDGTSFGSLRVRGPWIASGYFKLDKEIIDENGYMDTGDVAVIDEHGYMQITDRAKDVIKTGGEWISSIDLENAAIGHPGVAEACVIGIHHPKWDERPLMLVIAAGEQPSKEELNAYMSDKVAKWWLPDDIIFVQELPHTATGKLDKKVLRTQYKGYKLPTA
ncbi:MAG: long-chain fatty acid--CoA ligase [Pseudomonadales bacterium]